MMVAARTDGVDAAIDAWISANGDRIAAWTS